MLINAAQTTPEIHPYIRFWGEFAKNIVEILAIIIGGFWTYFVFLKGRTFKHRGGWARSWPAMTSQRRGSEGCHSAERLRDAGYYSKVILLSMLEDLDDLEAVLSIGVVGDVYKTSAAQ